MLHDHKYFTLIEASKIRGCTRQALYYAIKNKIMNATNVNGHWRVTLDDLLTYESELYSRMKRSKHNGINIYDEKKGLITVSLAADMVNVPKQAIYYAVRTKKLKAKKLKGAIVIDVKDLEKYKQPLLSIQENYTVPPKTSKRFYAMLA